MNYIEYLTLHRKGVELAYRELLEPILIDQDTDPLILDHIWYLVRHHDESKLSDVEEFVPYSMYHDGELTKDDFPYMKAWNHHQKSNKHHWQYWVLLRDSESPEMIALDMPLSYIIEMLCDWVSSSALHDTTANQWYLLYGHKMILSDKTREKVEHYLSKIKDEEEGIHSAITNYNNVRGEKVP